MWDYRGWMAGTALTIGNFDGVHLGHRSLINVARERVGSQGTVLALTFDPPPAVVLGHADNMDRLATLDRRRTLLKEAGVDEVIICQVDEDWLGQSPSSFLEHVVLPHRPDVVIEGPDFRFGKARSGDIDTLSVFGEAHGFEVCVVPPVTAPLSDLQSAQVSSSLIRWLLKRGRLTDAQRLLGYRWRIEGEVVAGSQRGREIGCPTANLDHGDLVLPADGVYAGVARCEAGTFSAAVSIGCKPTFEQSPRVLEAHLIGWDGSLDVYGWDLEIEFVTWLRDQARYASVRELMVQIERDLDAVRAAIPTSRV
ncbi:MAG: riboflavin biosynthesis protein RibF [Phycisphaerales bacterium]|nr:riboflavin biosynthesis protein RibF [Phycisphaerales bacterium]